MFGPLPPSPVRARPAPRPSIAARIAACGDRLSSWHDRVRQRRALIALSDRALHDLGISRADAWKEYGKPFWRN